ncbi:hypothetical protein BA059_26630 [Mycolicibacterium sp. (ex Dasyatis americana)]|nr:hypothetical protein BA059_26630 [Mycolicibacterium sp. (ex Dasyatis americana)]
MRFTDPAVEAWTQLEQPSSRHALLLRAAEVLDSIEFDTVSAWESAQDVRIPGVTSRLRRTLIEEGDPSFWVYWRVAGDIDPTTVDTEVDVDVLDFVHDY